jgi:hypothetical protein
MAPREGRASDRAAASPARGSSGPAAREMTSVALLARDSDPMSLYDSTFSRTVWRLCGVLKVSRCGIRTPQGALLLLGARENILDCESRWEVGLGPR